MEKYNIHTKEEDFKTINSESILGKGNIKLQKNIKVEAPLYLKNNTISIGEVRENSDILRIKHYSINKRNYLESILEYNKVELFGSIKNEGENNGSEYFSLKLDPYGGLFLQTSDRLHLNSSKIYHNYRPLPLTINGMYPNDNGNVEIEVGDKRELYNEQFSVYSRYEGSYLRENWILGKESSSGYYEINYHRIQSFKELSIRTDNNLSFKFDKESLSLNRTVNGSFLNKTILTDNSITNGYFDTINDKFVYSTDLYYPKSSENEKIKGTIPISVNGIKANEKGDIKVPTKVDGVNITLNENGEIQLGNGVNQYNRPIIKNGLFINENDVIDFGNGYHPGRRLGINHNKYVCGELRESITTEYTPKSINFFTEVGGWKTSLLFPEILAIPGIPISRHIAVSVNGINANEKGNVNLPLLKPDSKTLSTNTEGELVLGKLNNGLYLIEGDVNSTKEIKVWKDSSNYSKLTESDLNMVNGVGRKISLTYTRGLSIEYPYDGGNRRMVLNAESGLNLEKGAGNMFIGYGFFTYRNNSTEIRFDFPDRFNEDNSGDYYLITNIDGFKSDGNGHVKTDYNERIGTLENISNNYITKDDYVYRQIYEHQAEFFHKRFIPLISLNGNDTTFIYMDIGGEVKMKKTNSRYFNNETSILFYSSMNMKNYEIKLDDNGDVEIIEIIEIEEIESDYDTIKILDSLSILYTLEVNSEGNLYGEYYNTTP